MNTFKKTIVSLLFFCLVFPTLATNGSDGPFGDGKEKVRSGEGESDKAAQGNPSEGQYQIYSGLIRPEDEDYSIQPLDPTRYMFYNRLDQSTIDGLRRFKEYKDQAKLYQKLSSYDEAKKQNDYAQKAQKMILGRNHLQFDKPPTEEVILELQRSLNEDELDPQGVAYQYLARNAREIEAPREERTDRREERHL